MPTALFTRSALAVSACALTACAGAFSNGSTALRSEALPAGRGVSAPPPAKTVYATSRGNARILGFAILANGNVPPSVTTTGPKTMLTDPVALALDSAGRIYAANDTANDVFIFPAGSNGNVAPKVLGGSKVPFKGVAGIMLSKSGYIYVSDYKQNAIFVFTPGSYGNRAPIREIVGSKTQLSVPVGMAVDPSTGHLFVANETYPWAEPIVEFASNANGNVAPIAYIGGSKTMLVEPQSVSLDSAGRIIVPSNGNSVLIFSKGSSGNVAPAAVIIGSKTKLAGVSPVGVDPSNEIFVTECCPTNGAIYVFASRCKRKRATNSIDHRQQNAPRRLALSIVPLTGRIKPIRSGPW
jgi:hypothetical protein